LPICPRGHDSVAGDYCDECGTPIGAAVTPVPGPPETPAAPDPPSGEPCPDCGTPRGGRFCEVCGLDFLAESPQSPGSLPEQPSIAQAADLGPAGQPRPHAPTAAWRIVVSADRAYHARMRAASMPNAEPIAFPAFCPDRRFAAQGVQLLIGRRSRSRGIEPDIDLTGPPEDAAVSHAHALLVSAPDGGWSLVDLDSANGTYVNEGIDPIQANVPVPVKDGDRIHVGAWTTLTLQAG
jgi:hypothetical protein